MALSLRLSLYHVILIKPFVMKNLRLAIFLISILFFVSSFFKPATGTIKGTVSPPDGGLRVLAISNADTSRGIINEGVFVITNVKQGNYVLIVEAKSPYKNAARENVMVTEDGTTDVGEIKLSQ